MKLTITLLLSIACLSAHAKKVWFKHNETLGKPANVEIEIQKKLETIPVWKSSESNCECVAETFQEKFAFNFSCVLPNEYRTQVKVECSKYDSQETPLYVFMCRNFYIWCEK